jgi:hypothetical protein
MAAESQRGQTMPFLGLMLFVLVGALGLSVDVGSYRYDQRLQQSAADSAAIAGAAELNGGSANATAAAKADSAKNGFTDGVNGVTVTVNTNYSDQYTGASGAVQVVVNKAYPKYFGGVLSPGNTTIAATAVARAAGIGPACVYQLSPGGSPNFNGMTFNGPQCGIVMNGTGNFNGAHIDAAFIGYAGGAAPNENGATFTEAQPEPTLTVIDPCPRIPGCYYFSNNPPSTASCPAFQGNGYHGFLNPGCYGSINLNGAVVTFNPGVYVINSSTNFNGATLTGTGVTFYVTSTGSFNFNGARINLSPPTTGSTAGVLIYQIPGNSANPNFNGATSAVVSGLMYFPSVSVNFNGSLGAYTVLVVGDVNFNGSTQSFPSPPPNGSFIQQPTLAE